LHFKHQGMNKIYYLKTCSTCIRIIKSLQLPSNFVFQDIKEEEITVKQLEELYKMAGSHEALFSKKAKLYKEMGLKDANLAEADFKNYILQHYTFLSRPVIIFNHQIFVGNRPKTIEEAKKAIHG